MLSPNEPTELPGNRVTANSPCCPSASTFSVATRGPAPAAGPADHPAGSESQVIVVGTLAAAGVSGTGALAASSVFVPAPAGNCTDRTNASNCAFCPSITSVGPASLKNHVLSPCGTTAASIRCRGLPAPGSGPVRSTQSTCKSFRSSCLTTLSICSAGVGGNPSWFSHRFTLAGSPPEAPPSGTTVMTASGRSGATANAAKRICCDGKGFHPAGTVHVGPPSGASGWTAAGAADAVTTGGGGSLGA